LEEFQRKKYRNRNRRKTNQSSVRDAGLNPSDYFGKFLLLVLFMGKQKSTQTSWKLSYGLSAACLARKASSAAINY
jgi:hypothetical protein